MKALEDARKTEADLAGQIDDALAKIASNTDRLVLAEEKIMRVTAELGKLGDKSLELSVLEILEGSIRELVKLKADVEKLVVLFHNILVEVQDTAKGQLEGFLDPIRKAITEGAEPNTVDTLDIRKGSKKQIMMTAFEMQGRFSAISQISGMYIKVSNELIRPGITKVENLVVASNVDYPIQLKEFKKWCHESVQKIEGLAKDSNVVMAASVSNGIELLRQRVIEAAEDADR